MKESKALGLTFALSEFGKVWYITDIEADGTFGTTYDVENAMLWPNVVGMLKSLRRAKSLACELDNWYLVRVVRTVTSTQTHTTEIL